MTTRGATIILASALLLAGCTTSGTGSPSGRAAASCYFAAKGRGPSAAGVRACDMVLAGAAVAPAVRAATLVNRGALHLRAGAIPAALADFDAAIATTPDSAEAYFNKGMALIQIGGRDAEVVAVLTQALDHQPARPELVYFHRAGAHENLGRLRAAYDDYVEAAQLAPDWAEPATELRRFKFIRRKTMTG